MAGPDSITLHNILSNQNSKAEPFSIYFSSLSRGCLVYFIDKIFAFFFPSSGGAQEGRKAELDLDNEVHTKVRTKYYWLKFLDSRPHLLGSYQVFQKKIRHIISCGNGLLNCVESKWKRSLGGVFLLEWLIVAQ